MRIDGIIAIRALTLLMGSQQLVTALPALDIIWSRINTERYWASIDDCNLDEKDCSGPRNPRSVVVPETNCDPAINEADAIYQIEAQAAPAATATTLTEPFFTPSPCLPPDIGNPITPGPMPFIELQRRADAFEGIPSSLKSLESKPTPPATAGGPLSLLLCDGGSCPPFFKILDRGICLCLGPFPTQAVQ